MSTPAPLPPRHYTLLAGIAMQTCLGSVYAWSFFTNLLQKQPYGWSNGQTSAVFSLAIGFLGLTAACVGPMLPKWGFRKPALAGAALFMVGHLIAACALSVNNHLLMCLGYGVIGGIGIGLGYVTTVSAAAARYPDKKGLATGLVVMGFGLGAALMSKVLAPLTLSLMGGDMTKVFLTFGGVFAVAATLSASQLRAEPPAAKGGASAKVPGETGTFSLVWGMFFLNCLSGLGILAFQSPLMIERLKAADPAMNAPEKAAELAAAGATLIAVAALANALGRSLWGGLSDRIGRVNTFLLLLGTQAAVFALLPSVASPLLFGALICYVMLCYGGGFGTIPALVGDTFGTARMGTLYGRMLTAWGAAGVAGPALLGFLKDKYGAEASVFAFRGGAAALAAGFVIALVLRAKGAKPAEAK